MAAVPGPAGFLPVMGGRGALGAGRLRAGRLTHADIVGDQTRGIVGLAELQGHIVIEQGAGLKFRATDDLAGVRHVQLETQPTDAHWLRHERVENQILDRRMQPAAQGAVDDVNRTLMDVARRERNIDHIQGEFDRISPSIDTLEADIREFDRLFRSFDTYKPNLEAKEAEFAAMPEAIEKQKADLTALGILIGKRLAAYGENDFHNQELVRNYNALYTKLYDVHNSHVRLQGLYDRKLPNWRGIIGRYSYNAASNFHVRNVVSSVAGTALELAVLGYGWPAVVGSLALTGAAAAISYKYPKATKYAAYGVAGTGALVGAALSGVKGLTGGVAGLATNIIGTVAYEYFRDKNKVDIFNFGDAPGGIRPWTPEAAEQLRDQEELADISRGLQRAQRGGDPRDIVRQLTEMSGQIDRAIEQMQDGYFTFGKDLTTYERIRLTIDINRSLLREFRAGFNGGRPFGINDIFPINADGTINRDMSVGNLLQLKNRILPFYINHYGTREVQIAFAREQQSARLKIADEEHGPVRRRRVETREGPVARGEVDPRSSDPVVAFTGLAEDVRSLLFGRVAKKITQGSFGLGKWKFSNLEPQEREFIDGMYAFHMRLGVGPEDLSGNLNTYHLNKLTLEPAHKTNLLSVFEREYREYIAQHRKA